MGVRGRGATRTLLDAAVRESYRVRSTMPPRIGAVNLYARARGGEPLPRLRASTMVKRGSRLCRRKLNVDTKLPHYFTLEMEVGEHTVFVSAPGYYEAAQRIRFSASRTPQVNVVLEPRHRASFRPVGRLSREVNRIIRNSAGDLDAGAMFLRLSNRQKAGALNVLAKMEAVRLRDRSVLSFVDRIQKFAADRIYVRLLDDSGLQAAIDRDIGEGNDTFTEALGALHPGFDAGSYKTTERTGQGNLQLSFAEPDGSGSVLVDADIDIYTDVLRHMFGEVFLNHLTNARTDPFRVYHVLAEADIRPEYELQARAVSEAV